MVIPLCFGLKRGDYEGRLDVQFYLPKHRELEDRIKNSGKPVYNIGQPQISRNVVDGPFGSDLKVEEYVSEGVPLIRVSNCRTGQIEVTEEMVYITENKHQELKRSEILPGDVLLTKAGAILGYSAVFPDHLIRGNITSHLAAIRPAKGVLPRYLSEFLTSSIGIQQIYRWGNKSTRPELNTEEVRALKIILPDDDTQSKLVNEMDSARTKYRCKREEASSLLIDIDKYIYQLLGICEIKPARNTFAVRRNELITTLSPERYKGFQIEKQLPYNTTLDIAVELVESKLTPEKESPDEQLDWIRIDDLQNKPWQVDNVRTEVGRDIVGTFFEVQENDILIARLGPTIINAKFVLCPKLIRRTVASPEFLVLRCKKGWEAEAILWVLRTNLYRMLMYARSRGATPSRFRLDGEDLLNIPFPEISKDMQKKIAEEVHNRRNKARQLNAEAEEGLQTAKDWFVNQLLGGTDA